MSRLNPIADWVWSRDVVHEPLVELERGYRPWLIGLDLLYATASAVPLRTADAVAHASARWLSRSWRV